MHIYAIVVEMVFITFFVNFSVLLEYGLTSICELLIDLKQWNLWVPGIVKSGFL